MEKFWPLLRSWQHPHQGISQDKLPLHLGFLQPVHDARRRGKTLLGTIVASLVAWRISRHPGTRQEPIGYTASRNSAMRRSLRCDPTMSSPCANNQGQLTWPALLRGRSLQPFVNA